MNPLDVKNGVADEINNMIKEYPEYLKGMSKISIRLSA